MLYKVLRQANSHVLLIKKIQITNIHKFANYPASSTGSFVLFKSALL